MTIGFSVRSTGAEAGAEEVWTVGVLQGEHFVPRRPRRRAAAAAAPAYNYTYRTG